MDLDEVIKEGEYILLQRGEYQRIIQYNSGQTVLFGKGREGGQAEIALKNMLNHKYYSAFRILSAGGDEEDRKETGGKGRRNKLFVLEKVEDPATKTFSKLIFEAPQDLGRGKDNRNIKDDKSSQPLCQEDIVTLKESGMSSNDLLTTIVSSSKSFAQKTEFSQEKYLKKKEKVHGDLLLVRKLDLFVLADYYFKKDPAKILGLRVDTISQLMSYGDIHANGKYILYENACGLIVAAVLERMGGHGVLLHCHAGTNPQKQALTFMNLSEKVKSPLKDLDVFYLIKGRLNNRVEKSVEEDAALEVPVIPCKKFKGDGKNDEDKMEVDGELAQNGNETKTVLSNRKENEKSLELLKSPFNGLLICGKEHPLSLLQRLIQYVSPSSPIVVFSVFSEPLMECYMWLKEQGIGTNLQIVDNWMRNIQVESERTHPEINMSSSGGFILHGTLVRDASTTV